MNEPCAPAAICSSNMFSPFCAFKSSKPHPLADGSSACLEKGALAEGMATKGGARHFSKPWIEPGLLLTVLAGHEDLVKYFGNYEVISGQGAASPKGLITALDFILDLLEICAACELHPQP